MTIKDQLGELINLLGVEEQYPKYVLEITERQTQILARMLKYHKEEN